MQKRRKCLHVCQSFYVLGMTNGQCSLPDCIQFVLPYYCRRLLWLIFIHFSCSRKKCWLFSLLETLFFILMKRESGKQIFLSYFLAFFAKSPSSSVLWSCSQLLYPRMLWKHEKWIQMSSTTKSLDDVVSPFAAARSLKKVAKIRTGVPWLLRIRSTMVLNTSG